MRPSRPVCATKSPVVDSVNSTSLAKRVRIRSVGAERAAVRADDLLAVERDLAVVVGDHHEPPVAVGLQPREQLVAVLVGVAVAVVGVEEDDALDEVGDRVARVEKPNRKLPPPLCPVSATVR